MNSELREGHEPPCTDAVGLNAYLRNNADFIKALHIDTKKSKPWYVCNGLKYKKNPNGSYWIYPKLI